MRWNPDLVWREGGSMLIGMMLEPYGRSLGAVDTELETALAAGSIWYASDFAYSAWYADTLWLRAAAAAAAAAGVHHNAVTSCRRACINVAP